jgi:hypothetical protein
MKHAFSTIVAAALLGTSSLAAASEIDVMTQNQNVGADLGPVLLAAMADLSNPEAQIAFNAAVVDTLKKIAATRPAERARALATQIALRNPDVAGLQEAYEFNCLPYPGYELQGMGCDDPAIKGAFSNRLADVAAALHDRYVVAGKVTNLKIATIPFSVNGFPALLSMADRDAILVRRGLSASWVNFAPYGACAKPSDQGCNYLTAPPIFQTALGPIAIERGFLAVDVKVKGRDYRVFNTHLEQRFLDPSLPATRLLQVGQAGELASTALATWDGVKPLIVLGDFNSDPRDTIPGPYPTPYMIFAGNGFTDVWTLRWHFGPGFTCCQDEDLLNPRSKLYERIDLIFSRTRPSRVEEMFLLGSTPFEKTRPFGRGGLWPSDHAALAAELHFDW